MKYVCDSNMGYKMMSLATGTSIENIKKIEAKEKYKDIVNVVKYLDFAVDESDEYDDNMFIEELLDEAFHFYPIDSDRVLNVVYLDDKSTAIFGVNEIEGELFLIINRNLFNFYSHEALVCLIIHELVHVKQILDKRLVLMAHHAIWEGSTYPVKEIVQLLTLSDDIVAEYQEYPWEVEAYTTQIEFMKKFEVDIDDPEMKVKEQILLEFMSDFFIKNGPLICEMQNELAQMRG